MESREFSTESYFQTQRPPAGLEEKTKTVAGFVDRWREVADKRVVLVTVSDTRLISCNLSLQLIRCEHQSGGTTVPLEANT